MTDSNNHDHHDLDSIAALASGESNSLADGLLASCSQCRAEFEMQEKVRAWLAAATAIAMADHEREALHDRVESRIGQPEIDQHRWGAIERRRRRGQPTAWILRIGAVAAALAVLVGLTGVLGRLGTNGPGAFATTTAVAAESMVPAGDDGGLTDNAGASAPPATTAGMLAAEAASQSRMLAGGDAQAVRKEADMLVGETQQESSDERVAVPPCADQIEGLTPLRWAESRFDGEPIVIIIVEGDKGPEALVYRLADCDLVDLGQ